MDRLTKTYEDGSFGVAGDLLCDEDSHEFKRLLIKRLGEYEEKQMPKKPTMLYNYERCEDRECCPACKIIRVYKSENYCTECGQRLYWE